MNITREALANLIDHTNVRPDATYGEITALCDEAKRFGFHAVCVNSVHVQMACRLLQGSAVKVCSVVAFPFGAVPSSVKAFEAGQVVELGASELDVVCNLSAVKSGDYATVEDEIAAVVTETRGAVVKTIIETAYLTDEEIRQVCSVVKRAGAHFVKSSTGYAPRGAEIRTIRLMREAVGDDMGVKAAGGIRTFEQTLAFLSAGANRIGTSKGPSIMAGIRELGP